MSLAWTTDPLALVVNAVAAWRLAHLWTQERLQPLHAWREWLRLRIAASHRRVLQRLARRRPLTVAEQISTPPFEPLLTCPVCVGFWASVLVVVLASAPVVGRWWWPAAVVLAMSMVPVLPGVLAGKD